MSLFISIRLLNLTGEDKWNNIGNNLIHHNALERDLSYVWHKFDGIVLVALVCEVPLISVVWIVTSFSVGTVWEFRMRKMFALLKLAIFLCVTVPLWHCDSYKHVENNGHRLLITADWCGSGRAKQKGRQLITWKAGKKGKIHGRRGRVESCAKQKTVRSITI